MTSTAQSPTYAYTRPSTMATRSLITGSKPAELSSTSSQDTTTDDKQSLQGRTTDNYQQAAAAASAKPALSSSPDATVDTVQQNRRQQDAKRGVMEKILGTQPSAGYSTTSPTASPT